MTAREMYEALKAKPQRARFGFGRKPALVNVDLQNAYTRPAEFVTAYETDPRQIEYVNALARLFRANRCPVIWTYVVLSRVGRGLRRLGHAHRHARLAAEHQGRLAPRRTRRALRDRRAATSSSTSAWRRRSSRPILASLFTFHGVDTVVVTGGSTSGCVRATVVDGLSRSYRTSSRRSACPTSTRARTSPTSTTWR